MRRRFPSHPLTGVGAIIFRGDEVLLVQRGHEPSYGKWSLPGGLVELGESLEQAVQREVHEEVGLRVVVLDLVAVLDRVIKDKNGKVEYHYLILDFLCKPKGGEPIPASDALACAFVALKDLHCLPLTKGTETVIRRAYARMFRPSYDPVYMPDV